MIANELTSKTDFLTLTFGLTDGWWLFEDAERRMPGAPLLSRYCCCPFSTRIITTHKTSVQLLHDLWQTTSRASSNFFWLHITRMLRHRCAETMLAKFRE